MKILLVTFILWAITGCSAFQNKESISISNDKEAVLPVDWKFITDCEIQFYVPSNLKEKKVQPYDSCVIQLAGENIHLGVDVLDGQPNSKFSRNSEYLGRDDSKLIKTVIDGQSAEITTFSGAGRDMNAGGLNYGAVLEIPQLNLTMWSYSKTPQERENVMKIFNSVKSRK